MNDDLKTMVVSKTNLVYFYDIEIVVMGLICIMLLLEVILAFVMFVQTCDSFTPYY
jgi:hypothetical protein